ncbi:MAG TPA: hypothetical protein VIH37_11995 [Candidatus Limnocylindrales bacterium]
MWYADQDPVNADALVIAGVTVIAEGALAAALVAEGEAPGEAVADGAGAAVQ